MVSVVYYSLNDYNEIILSNVEKYTLEPSVLEIIDKLNGDLGMDSSSASNKSNVYSPSFSGSVSASSNYVVKKQHRFGGNHSSGKNKCDTEMSWHAPEFKPTVLEKKEGNPMNIIKSYLNKMSSKTYHANKEALYNIIKEHSENEDTLYTIANHIFDIASTNKFYSEMYASLYSEFIDEFSVFRDILLNYIEHYSNAFMNIKYVDQNKNYDEFCNYNKKNDMRKATTLFIVQLTLKKVLPYETLISIFDKIMNIMLDFVDKEGYINEVEEITENIALMVTHASSIFLNTEKVDTIKKVASWKAKDKASLSSRSIFKFMDMVSLLER